MTDSEIQLIANQVAANCQQMINDAVDRRVRLPSGVDSGGPFSSVIVNDQGQVIYAEAGGSNLVAFYRFDSGQNVGHSATRINMDLPIYDPKSLVTTGASWIFTAPLSAFYGVNFNLLMSSQANWTNGADAYAEAHVIFVGGGAPTSPFPRVYPPRGDSHVEVAIGGQVVDWLEAGQTLYIEASQGSDSTNLAVSASNSSVQIFQYNSDTTNPYA